MMNPISGEGVTITDDAVTFAVPTANASAKGLDPVGPGAPVVGAPLYVVVMHEGAEVLYKRVGDG